MAYKFSKGNREFGDIMFEDDSDTGIDFEANTVKIETGGSERVIVNNTGVGVGGTPSTNLHVKGDDARIRIDGDTDSHPGLELSENGTRKWIVYNNYSNDNLTFKTNSDIRMSIGQDGNVGIGTTSPGTNLDISSTTTEEPVCSLTNINADNKPASIQFYKDSESAADDDGLGSIEFYGRNAAGAKMKFASIDAYSSDVTIDDEAGEVVFSAMIGGRLGNSSLTECMVFGMEDTAAGQRGFALQINRQEAADIDFIVRGNTIANLFRTRCENDQVGIGGGPDANINAIFQVVGTTYASLPAPRMTTTQRNSLSNLAGGCMIYNITTNKLQCYNGSSWQDCF